MHFIAVHTLCGAGKKHFVVELTESYIARRPVFVRAVMVELGGGSKGISASRALITLTPSRLPRINKPRVRTARFR